MAPAGEVDFVIAELDQPIPDRVVATGQKACPHAIGALAQPQVEARRLNLVGRKRRFGSDDASLSETLDGIRRLNPIPSTLPLGFFPSLNLPPYRRSVPWAKWRSLILNVLCRHRARLARPWN